MKGLFWGLLIGLVVAAIIWIFFLRPSKAPTNPVLQNRVDSFTRIEKAKDSALKALEGRLLPKTDSLQKLVDTLQDDAVSLRDELQSKNDLALFYARQVQYYKAKIDTGEYRKACDLLAERVILDSATIDGYLKNTDRLIYTFAELVKDKDSIIITQKSLILSDSVLIASQKDLNDKQQKDINNLVKKGKVTAWIGRSLLVVAAGLAVALAVK